MNWRTATNDDFTEDWMFNHYRYKFSNDKLDTDLFEVRDGALMKIAGTGRLEFNAIEILDESVSEDRNKETLQIAMALVRCGLQMACEHILLEFGDKKIPDWFGGILLDMMDKEKKRQFDWVKLKQEMEKMDIAHLMPKDK